jgi:predicted alpha/beta-hydrolase family hydrolase
VNDGQHVSGLLQAPLQARACYVLAHGAGADMAHPFMAAIANGLAERGIATLRYQFPYMEQGSKRPNAPKLAQATVRAAVLEAARLVPELALFAGGKSFGARMTSQPQAASPLPGVRGLVFIGFPLHPAGQPSDERGKHLFNVHIPMLFSRTSATTIPVRRAACMGTGSNVLAHRPRASDARFATERQSRDSVHPA